MKMKMNKNVLTIGDATLCCDDDDLDHIPADLQLRLAEYDWWDAAEEEYSNDIQALRRYPLSGGESLLIWSDQGYPEGVEITDKPMLEHLAEYATCADREQPAEPAEVMAEFDVPFADNPFLQEASKDWPGECRVWHIPHYYAGTWNAPGEAFAQVADDDPEQGTDARIREFDTFADAQAYCDRYYSEPSGYDGIPACNVLSHGQAAADTLKIVER